VLLIPWRYASEGDRAQQVEQILVARSPTCGGAGATWQKMLRFSTKRLRVRGYPSTCSRCQQRGIPAQPRTLTAGAAAVGRAFRDATSTGSTEFLPRVRS
jgi:hypothetical protein